MGRLACGVCVCTRVCVNVVDVVDDGGILGVRIVFVLHHQDIGLDDIERIGFPIC